MSGHKISWFVYVGTPGTSDYGRIPRESTMRGRWDYDATCTCGWDSHHGGGLERSVRRAVDEHKWDVSNGFC